MLWITSIQLDTIGIILVFGTSIMQQHPDGASTLEMAEIITLKCFDEKKFGKKITFLA
jgi:hypothetical protein